MYVLSEWYTVRLVCAEDMEEVVLYAHGMVLPSECVFMTCVCVSV